MRQACAVDARVALLEIMNVLIIEHVGRQLAVLDVASVTVPMPPPPSQRGDHGNHMGVPPPHGFGRRFSATHSCFAAVSSFSPWKIEVLFFVALRERHRAQLATDFVAESWAWKLFGLVPIMLLHRPGHTGSVGRDELFHRADEFVKGRWADLLNDAQDHAVRQPKRSPTWSR